MRRRRLLYMLHIVALGHAMPELWGPSLLAQGEAIGRVTPMSNRVEAYRGLNERGSNRVDAYSGATRLDTYSGSSFGAPNTVLSSEQTRALYSEWGNQRELEWSIGNVAIQPSLNYEARYSDNIRENNAGTTSDFIHTVSPRLTLNILDAGATGGSFAYSPRFRFFQDNSEFDTVNHQGRFSLAHGWQRLSMSARGSFAVSEDPLLEGGVRSNRTTWNAELAARYLLTGRINANLEVDHLVRSFGQAFDTEQTAANAGLSYDIGPRTDVGFLVGFGRQSAEAAPDSDFQNFQLTVDYDLAEKLAFNMRGGAQFRQFSGDGLDRKVSSWILNSSLQWRVRESTAVTLDASRRVAASNFARNNADITTTVSGSVRQRVFDRVELGLAVGFGFVSSESVQSGAAAARSRNFRFVNASVNYDLGNRWRLGAFYNYREREANSSVVGATVNETGIQLSLTF